MFHRILRTAGCGEYDSIADYINDTSPHSDNKQYTEEQLTGWDDAAKSYNFPKADGYNPYSRTYDEMWGICKAMSLVSGEEYDWQNIHGCCQGDYNRVIYPKNSFTEQNIRNFECEYFNLGTEWCVSDGDEKPDSPDEIKIIVITSKKAAPLVHLILSAYPCMK